MRKVLSSAAARLKRVFFRNPASIPERKPVPGMPEKKSLQGRFTLKPSAGSLAIHQGKGILSDAFVRADYKLLSLKEEPRTEGVSRLDFIREKELKGLFPKGRDSANFLFVTELHESPHHASERKRFQQHLNRAPSMAVLEELVAHGKESGLRGIALIHPSQNPFLLKLLSPAEKSALSRRYLNEATKLGFRESDTSRFLWLVFDK